MLSFIYFLLQIQLTVSRVEPRYVSVLLPKPHNAQGCEIDDGMPFAREIAVPEFVHNAVSPRVNNARNEGAELIEPFENPA
jgi:hypothetical protein